MNNRIIIVFLPPYCQGECPFPLCPEDIIRTGCAMHVIFYDEQGQRSILFVGPSEIDSPEKLENKIVEVLTSEYAANKIIYSVHPVPTLLCPLRWALLRNGLRAVDNYVNSFNHRCVDLCAEFYKPSILSLERRASFSCADIKKWLVLPDPADFSEDVNILNVEKLCRLL